MREHYFHVLLVALLGGAVASPARAQHADWRDSVRALDGPIKALTDSMIHGDSNAAEVLRSGDLVLGASPALRTAAIAALGKLVRARAAWFGDATPTSGGFRIVLRVGGDRLGRVGTVVVAGLPDSGDAARMTAPSDNDRMSDALMGAFSELMFESSPPDLRAWLEGPVAMSISEREREQLAAYGLVTGFGRMQRACVSGEMAACEVALSLKPATGDSSGPVFAPFLRMHFLQYALRLGGVDAWIRLRTSGTNGVESRLAAAARIPVDSLIVRWRAELLQQSATGSGGDTSRAATALVWIAALLAGALGGSRWA